MRPAIVAATAGTLALAVAGDVLLHPHAEPAPRVHVLRREPVPVAIEGPAALLVSAQEGFFARFVGGPADASLRIHLLTPRAAAEECTEHCPPGITMEVSAAGLPESLAAPERRLRVAPDGADSSVQSLHG